LSSKYEGRDEACPVSTGGNGGGAGDRVVGNHGSEARARGPARGAVAVGAIVGHDHLEELTGLAPGRRAEVEHLQRPGGGSVGRRRGAGAGARALWNRVTLREPRRERKSERAETQGGGGGGDDVNINISSTFSPTLPQSAGCGAYEVAGAGAECEGREHRDGLHANEVTDRDLAEQKGLLRDGVEGERDDAALNNLVQNGYQKPS